MGLFAKNNSAVAEPKAPAPAPGNAAGAAPARPRTEFAPVAPQPVAAPLTERQAYFQQMKVRIHQQLVTRLDLQNLRSLPPATVREEVRLLVRELC